MHETDSYDSILFRNWLPRVTLVVYQIVRSNACVQWQAWQDFRRIEVTILDADLKWDTQRLKLY